MPPWVPPVIALSLGVAIACGTGLPPAVMRSTVVRDSSGLQVVTHHLDFYRPIRRLDGDVLEIGSGTASDPDYEFFRITDVELLQDAIVISQANGEIRVFTPEGRFRQQIGRPGAGPGEFRSVDWMAAVGDTIVVSDPVQRRISLLTIGGQLLESWMLNPLPLKPSYGAAWAVGAMGTGRLLLRTQDLGGLDVGRTIRRTTHAIVWSPRLGTMLEVGAFPGDEVLAQSMGLPPFRRTLLLSVLGATRTIAVDTEHPEVRVFVGDRPTQVIRLSGNQSRDVNKATVDDLVADQMTFVPDRETQRRVAAHTRASVTHTATPALGDLVVGTDSSIWISSYCVASRGPFFWIVMDRDGTIESTVEVPAYHFVAAVNDRFVATIHRSHDTDVETVRLFARPH